MPGCEAWDEGVPEAYLTPEAYQRDAERFQDELKAARLEGEQAQAGTPEPQLIYEPEMWPEFVGTDRHADFLSWLNANDIDPDNVATSARVTVETGPDGGRLIRYATHLRNENGAKYLDETTGDAAQEERTAPVQVEPPMHWYSDKESTDGR
jgi:hypothetical protein